MGHAGSCVPRLVRKCMLVMGWVHPQWSVKVLTEDCAMHVKFMFCAAFLNEPWNGFQGKIFWSNGRNEQAQLDGCKTKQRNGGREREREEREWYQRKGENAFHERKWQKWRLSHPDTHRVDQSQTQRLPTPFCWDTIAQRKIQTAYLNTWAALQTEKFWLSKFERSWSKNW